MAFTDRSRPSRDAVLAAARRAFAQHGYERATVRAIAADAGVDPSMVIRYFDSKDKLFDAATEIDLALPDLATVPAPERGTVLAERFVALWDDPMRGEVLTLLLRSAPTSGQAARRIGDVFATQVRTMVDALDGEPAAAMEGTRTGEVAISTTRPEIAEGLRAHRAAALSAYILGTALTRYVLRLPPVADEPAEIVAATMAPIIQSILQP